MNPRERSLALAFFTLGRVVEADSFGSRDAETAVALAYERGFRCALELPRDPNAGIRFAPQPFLAYLEQIDAGAALFD